MKINKRKFLEAATEFKNRPNTSLFEERYSIDVIKLSEDVRQKNDLFDVLEILPVYNHNESDFYKWSVKAMLIGKLALKASVDFVPEHRIIEEDYELESEDTEIILGNLTVNGSLINKSRLIVLGDVHVKEKWVDKYTETAIAGNLIVDDSVLTEGNLSVGGKLSTKLSYHSYNQGFTTVLEGCKSDVLIEKDHGGSLMLGRIEAHYISIDELITEVSLKNNNDLILKSIEKLFTPDFVDSLKKTNSENKGKDPFDNFLVTLYAYQKKRKDLLRHK